MKQLTCEMCGSTDMAKQDGFFVCKKTTRKEVSDERFSLYGKQGLYLSTN